MLIATDTNAYSEIGAVASNVFSDIWPYLILILGVIIAFFILEMLIGVIPAERDFDRRTKEMLERGTRMKKVIESFPE